jgi:ABC-type multidrug transport system ATPase subunit
MDEAENCHRVAIIHAGSLAAVGPPAELKRTITPNLPRPSLADVFFAVVSPRAS